VSRTTSERYREAAEQARVVTQRANRRLDKLEWVLFGVGAVLAMLGGGVLAWIITGLVGWDFRSTWIGASLVLFIVAGTVAIVRIRMDAREDAGRLAAIRERDHG
jgi:uncharacterized membrane protein